MIQLSVHIRKVHSPDGGVLLDVKQGRMFRLNPIASQILDLLRQYEPNQVAEQLSREFGIGVEVALRDMADFLNTLERHRLTEVCSFGAPH